MTRRQCRKCPWKAGTDPRTIPNGYDEAKHAALERTIAREGDLSGLIRLRVMACHESKPESGLPCVGWLHNQFLDGNNIGLRWAVTQGRFSMDIEIDGPQKKDFYETLPDKE